MCSMAYLDNTNILVSAIFFRVLFNSKRSLTDLCLIICPSVYIHVVDFSILLLSFFIWVNSENWWLNCLLHVLWWLVFSLFLFCFPFLISLSHGHLTIRRPKPSPRGPQSSRVFLPVSQFQVEVLSTHRTLVWTSTRQGLGLDTPGLETVKSLGVNVWFCPKHWMLKWLISRHKYLIIYSICQFPVKRLLFPVMVKGVAGVQEAGMPPGRSSR